MKELATTFPNAIQTFTPAIDIVASDGDLVKQYQQAKEVGNFVLAAEILAQIPQATQKILSANRFNTIVDTCYALEEYFIQRYSPAYIVSPNQPANQEPTDFWFEVTN